METPPRGGGTVWRILLVGRQHRTDPRQVVSGSREVRQRPIGAVGHEVRDGMLLRRALLAVLAMGAHGA